MTTTRRMELSDFMMSETFFFHSRPVSVLSPVPDLLAFTDFIPRALSSIAAAGARSCMSESPMKSTLSPLERTNGFRLLLQEAGLSVLWELAPGLVSGDAEAATVTACGAAPVAGDASSDLPALSSLLTAALPVSELSVAGDSPSSAISAAELSGERPRPDASMLPSREIPESPASMPEAPTV